MYPWNTVIHPCVNIRQQPAPSRDGEARFFLSARRVENTFSTDSRIPSSQINPPLVYVNGIRTTGLTHKLSCLAISWLFNRAVLGVYNLTGRWLSTVGDVACEQCYRKTSGFDAFREHADNHGAGIIQTALDFGQCKSDYDMALVPESWVLLAKFMQQIGGSPQDIAAVFHARLASNAATQSLVGVLLSRYRDAGCKTIYILPHSQGCLITSIATAAFLSLLDALHLPSPLISVRALASPCPRWLSHPFLQVVKIKFDEDLIAKLSVAETTPVIRKEFDDSTVSIQSHDVRNYLVRFGKELEGWLPSPDPL